MKRIQQNPKNLLILLWCLSSFTIAAQPNCYDASVIDTGMICYQMGIPGVYCGCDGNTYSSPCEAYYHYGVTSGIWSMDGSCIPQGACKALFAYWQNPGTVEVQFTNYSFANAGIIGNGTSSWDFGDSTTSMDTDPLHVFPAAGAYNVCLTITFDDNWDTPCTDTYCETMYIGTTQPCIDSALIDTTQPCNMIYAPVCGCDGVTYENDCVAQAHGVISWSYGECYPNGYDCYAYFSYYVSDSTGMGIDFYDASNSLYDQMLWDFGDGSTLDTLPFSGVHHQYAATGLYNVCLTVSSDDSSCVSTYCESIPVAAQGICTDSSVIDTNVICGDSYQPVCGCDGNSYAGPCDAYYIYGVTSWTPGECFYYSPCDAKYYYWLDGDGYTVNFQSINADGTVPGGSNGTPGGNGQPSPSRSLLWDFGDGTTSTDEYPAHTYTDTSIHSYWVCLTVTDTTKPCTKTFCDSVYVGAYNYGCYAGFGYNVNPDGTVMVYPDSAIAGVPGWSWNGTDDTTTNGTGFSFPIDSTSSDTICIILVNQAMNCVDTFCVSEPEIYMAYLLLGYGNPEHKPMMQVSIYPNPASDDVAIELTLLSAADLSIKVRDLLGNEQSVITAANQPAGRNKIKINTSHLSPGVYIVESHAAGQSVFKKLVITR